MTLSKHKLNRDVAMRIVLAKGITSAKEIKLKVLWFNIVNPKNIFPLHPFDDVTIKISDLGNWEDMEA